MAEMPTMHRRRLFALAGGASAAVTLPAIAAPMVEMHAADVMPIAVDEMPLRAFTEELLKRVIRDVWDNGHRPNLLLDPAKFKDWGNG